MAFCSPLFYFSKLTFFFKTFFQEYHQNVKHFGSRSGPDIVSGLTWVQTVCKDYQQKTLAGLSSQDEAAYISRKKRRSFHMEFNYLFVLNISSFLCLLQIFKCTSD